MRIPPGAARRVAIASAVVVALLVSATAVTIWRYTSAIDSGDRALEARASSNRADQAVTAYWHEREAINEYLLRPAPGLLDEISNSVPPSTTTSTGSGATLLPSDHWWRAP